METDWLIRAENRQICNPVSSNGVYKNEGNWLNHFKRRYKSNNIFQEGYSYRDI